MKKFNLLTLTLLFTTAQIYSSAMVDPSYYFTICADAVGHLKSAALQDADDIAAMALLQTMANCLNHDANLQAALTKAQSGLIFNGQPITVAALEKIDAGLQKDIHGLQQSKTRLSAGGFGNAVNKKKIDERNNSINAKNKEYQANLALLKTPEAAQNLVSQNYLAFEDAVETYIHSFGQVYVNGSATIISSKYAKNLPITPKEYAQFMAVVQQGASQFKNNVSINLTVNNKAQKASLTNVANYVDNMSPATSPYSSYLMYGLAAAAAIPAAIVAYNLYKGNDWNDVTALKNNMQKLTPASAAAALQNAQELITNTGTTLSNGASNLTSSLSEFGNYVAGLMSGSWNTANEVVAENNNAAATGQQPSDIVQTVEQVAQAKPNDINYYLNQIISNSGDWTSTIAYGELGGDFALTNDEQQAMVAPGIIMSAPFAVAAAGGATMTGALGATAAAGAAKLYSTLQAAGTSAGGAFKAGQQAVVNSYNAAGQKAANAYSSFMNPATPNTVGANVFNSAETVLSPNTAYNLAQAAKNTVQGAQNIASGAANAASNAANTASKISGAAGAFQQQYATAAAMGGTVSNNIASATRSALINAGYTPAQAATAVNNVLNMPANAASKISGTAGAFQQQFATSAANGGTLANNIEAGAYSALIQAGYTQAQAVNIINNAMAGLVSTAAVAAPAATFGAIGQYVNSPATPSNNNAYSGSDFASQYN